MDGAKEGEQLCRSKWLGLIRHETLHAGAKRGRQDLLCKPVGQPVKTGTRLDSHLTVQSFIQAANQTLNEFSI